MGGAGYVNSTRATFILGFDPEDEDRRILARAKGNCGPVPPARAFRIKTYDPDTQFILQKHENFGHLSDEDRTILAGQLIRVEWEQGNVALSADDVVGRDGQNGASPSKVERAGDWLAQFLDRGPRESDEIFAAGLQAGHKKDSLYAAKQKRQIAARPNGFGGAWRWGLGDPNSWPEALPPGDPPLTAF